MPKRSRIFILSLALAFGACSAFQPPDAGGPRAIQAAYPIIVAGDTNRLQEALVPWQQVTQGAPAAEKAQVRLHPYTATIEGLPPNANLLLPRVGVNPTMSDEETRESLRRFITRWQPLIGADPDQLSLIDLTDQQDGTKLANYEQKPFRYPLRGPFGKLRIRFTPDRRVIDFSSTCLPNADRLQASLTAITPQIAWEDAIQHLGQARVSYSINPGQESLFTITPANKLEVTELVIYARNPPTAAGPAELHLAWEISVTNAPFKLIYVDAVKGDVLGTN